MSMVYHQLVGPLTMNSSKERISQSYGLLVNSCINRFSPDPHLVELFKNGGGKLGTGKGLTWGLLKRLARLPSGKHSQFAIENGHRNSGFTH